MFFQNSIRDYFTPVQPGIRHKADNVVYLEISPAEELMPFIYCYWELKTNAELKEPFNYRVVADGCIDIFFSLRKPHENFVMGFCKRYTAFDLDNSFHYVGIRFLPTMFPQLFNINASLISDRFCRLNELLPLVSTFISNNFRLEQSLHQIGDIINKYFIGWIRKTTINPDGRLYDALDIILKNYGVVNLKTDLDVGISERQLRRLFEFYVGDTPKTFSKVVRFQNILKAKPSSQSLRENKLFFDAGYYDQAHFIKEFKNYYGITPAKAFAR